jgi:hypothetical protein
MQYAYTKPKRRQMGMARTSATKQPTRRTTTPLTEQLERAYRKEQARRRWK